MELDRESTRKTARKTARKTDQYTLRPTPVQEQRLETVVWRGRELYNAGLQERNEAYERCGVSGVSVSCAMHSAQVPASTAVRAE
jgi:Helix-turn-helix domain